MLLKKSVMNYSKDIANVSYMGKYQISWNPLESTADNISNYCEN